MLETVAPTWMNVSLKMKNDPETDETFGWVLEMWADLWVVPLCAMSWKFVSLVLASSVTFAVWKVCICCGVCSSRCAAYSLQRLHDAGFASYSNSFLFCPSFPFSVFKIFVCYTIFQPPWDLSTRNKYILHYNYGCDYNLKVKYTNKKKLGDYHVQRAEKCKLSVILSFR